MTRDKAPAVIAQQLGLRQYMDSDMGSFVTWDQILSASVLAYWDRRPDRRREAA